MAAFGINLTDQLFRDFAQYVDNTIIRTTATVRQNCSAINRLNVVTGGGPNGTFCVFNALNSPILAQQNATVNCTLDAQSISDVTNRIRNISSRDVENFFNQQNSNTQGWLALAVGVGVNQVRSNTELSTMIANSFQNIQRFDCDAQYVSQGDQTLYLCGTYVNSPIDLSQNAAVIGTTSCIQKMLTQVFRENSTLARVRTAVDTANANRQGGIGDFFSGLGNVLYIIIGVIVLIIIAAIIFAIIRATSSSAPPTGAVTYTAQTAAPMATAL